LALPAASWIPRLKSAVACITADLQAHATRQRV
jgi:hypothetical protein